MKKYKLKTLEKKKSKFYFFNINLSYIILIVVIIIILHIFFFSKFKNLIFNKKWKKFKKNNLSISIIVPVYNTERWIEESLFSVISQSIRDFEIICINDGSTDKSKKILEKFAYLDYRIIIIDQENKGLAATRNEGLKFAFGKYILFLDSDDMFQNDTFKELLNIAIKENLEVIYFDAHLLFMPGMVYDKNRVNYYKRKKSYGSMSGKDLFSNIYLRERFSDSACLMMINRIWLNNNKIKFIEGIIYEDSIFSIQVMMKATHSFHINKQYYIYRIRENSIMSSELKPINLYSRIIGYKELIKLYENENLSNYQKKALFKFIKKIENHIQYLKNVMNENEWKFFSEKKNISNYEKILLILVSKVVPNKKKYKSSKYIEYLWKLFNSNNIEIYGIGINCIRLLELFNFINKTESIKGFVVPSPIPISVIKGKNIKILNDKKNIKKINSKNILVLEKKNKKEIKNLNELGYKNIIILDNNLNKILLRLLT